MGYRVLADAAMIAHFAFLAYVALGGFLAWVRPWAVLPHIVVAAYALGIVAVGWDCPLTHLENWARRRAGEDDLAAEGFVENYLTGVVYPEEHLMTARGAVALLIAVAWAGTAWAALRRRRAAREPISGVKDV